MQKMMFDYRACFGRVSAVTGLGLEMLSPPFAKSAKEMGTRQHQHDEAAGDCPAGARIGRQIGRSIVWASSRYSD